MKKVISMNFGSSTCSWKPSTRVSLDLKFTMSNTYMNSNLNPLTKFSSCNRSTKFKDILPCNISQMIVKTIPISTRIVISYAMKRGIPFWVWQKVNGNWENHMIRISQWRESHRRTNTSVRRKKEIQKSRTASVTIRDKNVIWDRKIIKEFTRAISSTRTG